MGYMTDKLSFNVLRQANVKRLPQFKNSKGKPAHTKRDGSDWSPAQWLQAVVGELGEYANVRKKFERGDIDKKTFNELARRELADVAIYFDILCLQLGFDQSEIIREKFNEVSERVNSTIYIGDDWDWHIRERKKQIVANPNLKIKK